MIRSRWIDLGALAAFAMLAFGCGSSNSATARGDAGLDAGNAIDDGGAGDAPPIQAPDASDGEACPVVGTWTPLPSHLRLRATSAYANGALWSFGGTQGDAQTATDVLVLDPTTFARSSTPTALSLNADDVLFAVTIGNTIVVLTSTAATSGRFDATSKTWSNVSSTGAVLPTNPYLGAFAIAAGSRVFVWSSDAAQGAFYDPATDVWTATAQLNAPTSACCSGGAWTGSEVVLWGSNLTAAPDAGFRYDPATSTWTSLPTAGAPSMRTSALLAWSGTDVIVWGGVVGDATGLSGARYNPTQNTWSPMASAPSFLAPVEIKAAGMVGSKFVAVAADATNAANTMGGAVYDPASDTWSAMSATNAPTGRDQFAVAFGDGAAYLIGGVPNGLGPDSILRGAVARYDVAGDAWSGDGFVDAPVVGSHGGSSGGSGTLVWAPSLNRALLWSAGGGYYGGGSFDPSTKTWSPISMTGNPDATQTAPYVESFDFFAAGVWSGSQFLVYSGVDTSGATYDPSNDTWTKWPSDPNAPSLRPEPAMVWTGSRAFVWSGYSPSPSTGGLFDPTSGTWSTIATAGAPSARIETSFQAVAIDNGRVVVWGGASEDDSQTLNDGATYDSVADTWTPMSSAGAPSARANYAATWTGQDVIYVGGHDQAGNSVADAYAYRPSTDTWRKISAIHAPHLDDLPAAIWTGQRAIFVGASDGSVTGGGSYDPATDSWSCLPSVNAPATRDRPMTVWTAPK